MQQLNLQLYGRTEKKRFNEQLSVRRSVTLTTDPQSIELTLEAPDREKLVELRFDPDDKPSEFVLHDLEVRSAAGEELYRWDGDPQSLNGLVSLRAATSNGQTILQSSSGDSFLLIPLRSPVAAGVSVRLSVSLVINSEGGAVADAVRSLQSVLRLAIDDLASEQEGLLDALMVQHAQARRERHAINEQLQSVLGRADRTEKSLRKLEVEVGGIDVAVTDTVSTNTLRIRDEILAEIRDDWRSVRQQVSDSAEAALKRVHQRDTEIAAGIQEEFAKLITAVHRVAASDDLLKEVRTELRVARDDEVINKLQRLQAEVRIARQRAESMERSLSWRLTRPFRILAGGSHGRGEPEDA